MSLSRKSQNLFEGKKTKWMNVDRCKKGIGECVTYCMCAMSMYVHICHKTSACAGFEKRNVHEAILDDSDVLWHQLRQRTVKNSYILRLYLKKACSGVNNLHFV